MALVEVQLLTHLSLFALGSWGDASVRNHPTVHFFYDVHDDLMIMGNASKAVDPDWVSFLRYNLHEIPSLPSGATFTRGKFKVTSGDSPVVNGALGFIRVGHLEHDGRWDRSDNGSGWNSPYYPANESFSHPFPTLPQDDAVISGRLVNDQFMGQWDYDVNWVIGETKIIGDAPYSPEYDLDYGGDTPIADAINADRLTYGSDTKYIAFTMDPFQLPAGANENVQIGARDFGGGTFEGVVLFLEYDENPPTITNVPKTEAFVGAPYSEQMTATDPTGQDVTFAFLLNPAGAIMVDGLISWTPTVGQLGAQTFRVEATDEDGFTDVLQWVVTVTSPAALSGDVEAITILEGEVETVTVLNASSIQATPVLDSGDIEATPVLDASVEGTPVLDATQITSTPILDATRIEIEPLE